MFMQEDGHVKYGSEAWEFAVRVLQYEGYPVPNDIVVNRYSVAYQFIAVYDSMEVHLSRDNKNHPWAIEQFPPFVPTALDGFVLDRGGCHVEEESVGDNTVAWGFSTKDGKVSMTLVAGEETFWFPENPEQRKELLDALLSASAYLTSVQNRYPHILWNTTGSDTEE